MCARLLDDIVADLAALETVGLDLQGVVHRFHVIWFSADLQARCALLNFKAVCFCFLFCYRYCALLKACPEIVAGNRLFVADSYSRAV